MALESKVINLNESQNSTKGIKDYHKFTNPRQFVVHFVSNALVKQILKLESGTTIDIYAVSEE